MNTQMTSVKTGLPDYGQGLRVLVYTAGTDFNGEQFFDIKADDLYPDGEEGYVSEVAEAATHWMPVAALTSLVQAGQEIAILTQQLAESRANDRTAMQYLADIRKAAGHEGDFPSLIAKVTQLRAALTNIRGMTDVDNPASYRCDDREGCLDTVFSAASRALEPQPAVVR